jgi:VCBS repeat-containing protein
VTIALSKVSIVNPDGSKLIFPTNVDDNGAFFDTKTLPLTGTYKLQLNPTGGATGDATLTVYDVPADATATLATDGTPATISITTPGQDARLSFSASAGQDLTLDLSSVTIGSSGCCSAELSVRKPDGTRLVFPLFVGTSGASIDFTTTVAGTYSIELDPLFAATGDATFALAPTPAAP